MLKKKVGNSTRVTFRFPKDLSSSWAVVEASGVSLLSAVVKREKRQNEGEEEEHAGVKENKRASLEKKKKITGCCCCVKSWHVLSTAGWSLLHRGNKSKGREKKQRGCSSSRRRFIFAWAEEEEMRGKEKKDGEGKTR